MYAELLQYDDILIHREKLQVKEKLLWWQERGLTYTATGYGKKIPTAYMVRFNNRWYRVYCAIFSNIGSLYIVSAGEKITVEIYN